MNNCCNRWKAIYLNFNMWHAFHIGFHVLVSVNGGVHVSAWIETHWSYANSIDGIFLVFFYYIKIKMKVFGIMCHIWWRQALGELKVSSAFPCYISSWFRLWQPKRFCLWTVVCCFIGQNVLWPWVFLPVVYLGIIWLNLYACWWKTVLSKSGSWSLRQLQAGCQAIRKLSAVNSCCCCFFWSPSDVCMVHILPVLCILLTSKKHLKKNEL